MIEHILPEYMYQDQNNENYDYILCEVIYYTRLWSNEKESGNLTYDTFENHQLSIIHNQKVRCPNICESATWTYIYKVFLDLLFDVQ